MYPAALAFSVLLILFPTYNSTCTVYTLESTVTGKKANGAFAVFVGSVVGGIVNC